MQNKKLERTLKKYIGKPEPKVARTYRIPLALDKKLKVASKQSGRATNHLVIAALTMFLEKSGIE